MEMENDVIEGIISKYLCGASSEADDKLLYEWLQANGDNRQLFFEIKALWNARSRRRDWNNPYHFARELSRLNSRIDRYELDRQVAPEHKSIASNHRHSRRIRNWIVSAAAVAIIVLTGITIYRDVESFKRYYTYTNPSIDSIVSMTLADGTHVWLKGNTTLTHAKNFGYDRRAVTIDGEAFFDVEHDPQHPFTVVTDAFRVRVLGTSFNVNYRSGDHSAEVVLESGTVKMLNGRGDNLITLHPGQRAVYAPQTGDLDVQQINANHFVLIKYGVVAINDATIDDIVSKVEALYGVHLSVDVRDNQRRYNCNFLKSNTIEQVMQIIEYMTGGKCEITRP